MATPSDLQRNQPTAHGSPYCSDPNCQSCKDLREVQEAIRTGTANDEQKVVQQANIRGDRRTLIADSAIPATMAAGSRKYNR